MKEMNGILLTGKDAIIIPGLAIVGAGTIMYYGTKYTVKGAHKLKSKIQEKIHKESN